MMELRTIFMGLMMSLCQGQFFSPSFAVAPVPFQLGFPVGFTSQTLSLPIVTGPPPKSSKKNNAGTYSPFPLPNDPGASQSITNLLTSSTDRPIVGNKAQEIQALFDQGSFRSYNLQMSAQNIAIMQADPTKELRVHCRVTTDYNTPQAKDFGDFAVGCGYKGSVGSLRVCLDEYHRDNHICRKLSIRVDARDFDQGKSGNKTAPLIYGMRSLTFAGMPVDLSMMSERTAYYLMNSLGITAPTATHAKLFLNGKYLGLYSFVQAVDQSFTELKFPNDAKKGKGALYKELWFNPLHMQDLEDSYVSGSKKEDSFMREIMSAVESTPLSGGAPQQFFDRYFDVQSLIDLTAFNTVIGDTDDWRQRHNFFLYVREDAFGKKVVWIPWDYDRLYDEAADTRGALKGNPWWDISRTATPTACNAPIRSAQDQANALGGTPARIQWNKDIFDQLSLDINVPVTCDKLTQLIASALGPRIRQRTREIAAQISVPQVRSLWTTWNAQIQTALSQDPSGPTIPVMIAQQNLLANHLTNSQQKAITQANQGDGASGASTFSSGVSAFAPASASFTPSFTSVQSFTPSFTSSFSSTPSFAAPVASFSTQPSFASFATPSFSTPSFSAVTVPSFTPSFTSSPFASSSFLPTSVFVG